MKTFATVAFLLIVPLTAPHVAAADVTATLFVNAGHPAAPGWRDCAVSVPAGANVGALLDAAVAQGCLLSWGADSYPGYGRYVTCIDEVCGQLPTYWAFYVDGAYSGTGIDDTAVSPGSTYEFTYEQWVVPVPI